MNLVLARVLDAAAYGAVAIQTGIFMIFSMGGSALQMAVVHRETATEHGDTRALRWTWVRRLRGLCAVGVLVTAGVSLVVCRPAAILLSYPHPLAIAEAVVGAAVWMSLSIERGLLQARGAYGTLARNLVFESCVRITVVIVLVGVGFGVNGAGVGLVVGIVAGTEHALRAAGRTPHRLAPAATAPAQAARARAAERDQAAPPQAAREQAAQEQAAQEQAAQEQAARAHARSHYLPDDDPFVTTGPIPVLAVRSRPGLRKNTLTALGALVPLALLQNMDVVIVGWLNQPIAGAYAAISTACKVPVFIGLAVANFLLPEAARRLREGVPARGVLAIALAFVVAPGLVLTAVGRLGAEPLLALVFGAHLTAGAPALWVLSLAMTCLSVTLMFMTYLLGAGENRVVWVLGAGTLLTVAGLVAAGGELVPTATVALACQALTAGLVGVMVLMLHRRAAAHPDHRGAAGPGLPDPRRRDAGLHVPELRESGLRAYQAYPAQQTHRGTPAAGFGRAPHGFAPARDAM
jgi:O-antigen/teichoic acid export membrane protein